ncbi:glycine betaine/proline transport system substrate-binding protein [Stackebrandtia endophytica]|uniref:Glycine betaine/proline transport system substrate-binding protein n=1 Tax=Stackebrandtia endophytica TaxID=1496996 RepID=A0A543AQY0_9ACTN|nr:glycine betaine ABC transporter substrate-binding protein [Stackebrandtia endophytica]TQL74987.1 glycine betaine/proline transport system substrate-binding protein [Stackebrandtia endophytica]
MSNLLRKSAAIVAAAALAGTMAACGGDDAGDSKELTIGYINWDEAVAASHMWKLILEEEGYEVNLEELEPGLIFEGMANGDIDFFLDGWLPTTHASYMEKYGDQLETLGVWYDNASLSVAVPTYVEDVNSMEDLADNADTFDGKIIGIEEGAGLTKATQEELIPGYELDGVMNLVTSSTPAMLSELDTAIANNEPIVVTLWHPHWAYAKYDLKDLEDPLGTLGGAEEITIFARSGFSADQAEVTSMLEKFVMTDEQLASLEDLMFNENKDDLPAGAQAWLDANPDFVGTLK